MTATHSHALNAVCPYFTMFPLDFPLGVLGRRVKRGDVVLDPFCGRGTTNYAARLLGVGSVGIDSSPVAVAVTEAKLATTTPGAIKACASRILKAEAGPAEVPGGEFWVRAFDPEVLEAICRLRSALLRRCDTPVRKALRAIVMGALHGPRNQGRPSHLSNQCPRTYAPKPGYVTAFWRRRRLLPPKVDVLDVIGRRAERYYAALPVGEGKAIRGDSRQPSTFDGLAGRSVDWVVTSPPYYGMRTYIPDQWLRHWFVGGPSDVDYSTAGQLAHGSPESFADQLRLVWVNVGAVAGPDAQMVVRFGGIVDRAADPLGILRQSFRDSPWRLTTVRPAGSADSGRRQSYHFGTTRNASRLEYDAWARLR